MAYTEFYCQNGGSNLNSGSTSSNTAAYTSTSGNWVQATKIFTPTDSSNPSSTVNVGDFASVYPNGASVGVFIGRITAVQNATNGTITVAGGSCGISPANQTGTGTIKVGGAWQGPNGASGFPFTLSGYGGNKDATAHLSRANMKNDQTYSVTASFTFGGSGAPFVMEGYSATPGDGGKATFDGGTSTGSIVTTFGIGGSVIQNIIFKTSITSGSSNLVTAGVQATFVRCVFTGARVHGLFMSVLGSDAVECEAYNNNTSNTGGGAGFIVNQGRLFRCFSHDNVGTNSDGIRVATSGFTAVIDCISSGNTRYGFTSESTAASGGVLFENCDSYNNGLDGLWIISTSVTNHWIENCNFIKNSGAGINNTSVINSGFIYNCGYGSGTQANGSADTTNNLSKTGTVTYASNVTPWVDPANGDFRISLSAAKNAGRGAFTQTSPSSGAVGYPDIGAAQHLGTSTQKAYTFGG